MLEMLPAKFGAIAFIGRAPTTESRYPSHEQYDSGHSYVALHTSA